MGAKFAEFVAPHKMSPLSNQCMKETNSSTLTYCILNQYQMYMY